MLHYASAVTKRPVYVHVGSSKTGTSALQRGLTASVDALAEAGIGVPFVGRQAHMQKLVRPLGWTIRSGFVDPMDRGKLSRLVPFLRDTRGERLLISNEDLAEAGPEQVEAFTRVAEEADLDVHVILTARDWSLQLPSEWQQFLKHRLTADYETFLGQVRDRAGVDAAHFWRRQDVPDICDRWGRGLDPSRIHVIPVPPVSRDADAVFRLFGQVVGYPPSSLEVPSSNVNASYGLVEAEILRRVNVALGDRLADYENEYMPVVRSVLAKRALARGASARISLPPEHVGWVRAVARQQRDTVLERGYLVHGDLDLLVPAPDVGRPLPELDEAEVANAAVATLANFAVLEFEIRSRRERNSPASPPTPPSKRTQTDVRRRGRER